MGQFKKNRLGNETRPACQGTIYKMMKKVLFLLTMVVMTAGLSGCWQFSRDQAEKDAESKGRQILLEAESSKKAMIEEAKAKQESSLLDAETKVTIAKAEALAEVERAKGVAQANQIIGESLQGNEGYLRYLWIMSLKDGNSERIYIPTEAGLPIFEAK